MQFVPKIADKVFISWISLISFSTDTAGKNFFPPHIWLFLLLITPDHRLPRQRIFFNCNSFYTSFILSTQSTLMPNRCLAATQDDITISIFPFLLFRAQDFLKVSRVNEPQSSSSDKSSSKACLRYPSSRIIHKRVIMLFCTL